MCTTAQLLASNTFSARNRTWICQCQVSKMAHFKYFSKQKKVPDQASVSSSTSDIGALNLPSENLMMLCSNSTSKARCRSLQTYSSSHASAILSIDKKQCSTRISTHTCYPHLYPKVPIPVPMVSNPYSYPWLVNMSDPYPYPHPRSRTHMHGLLPVPLPKATFTLQIKWARRLLLCFSGAIHNFLHCFLHAVEER